MASKKDLADAQSFSRRRLVTAFVSGAPGGREIEPQRPMRAVVGGLAVALLLGVGSYAAGFLKSTPPKGWDDNKLIVAKDTGERYVAIKRRLYPVINTTSGRLLIPSEAFKVYSVDSGRIAKSPKGDQIGIVGAPDSLTAPAQLSNSGWRACTSPSGGVAAQVGASARSVPAPDKAVVAVADGITSVITDGHRLPIPKGEEDNVLRALSLESAQRIRTTSRWTQLFPEGTAARKVELPGFGKPLPNLPAGASAGSILAVGSGAEERRYLVTPEGELDPVNPFWEALYRLGRGATVPEKPIATTTAQLSQLKSAARPVVPHDWPTAIPQELTTAACATLVPDTAAPGQPATAHAELTTTPEAIELPRSGLQTRVDVGTGALVQATAQGVPGRGPVYAVDQAARYYAVVGDGQVPLKEVLGRLGYAPEDVSPAPQPWLELFTAGPRLSVKDAQTVVTGAP
ncbi:MAG: type VII secretion protein EccB [Micrococcales bacterium]|nr:type VII secretion protein EccB [Micrococcales bacterium]